ncbi:MAG TPA: hypothetical protein VNB06_08305 [Thermoanaerobaculia bacterium]|nr:hypothetical protein [Thermoanaerobaculia bacterium]
MFFGLALVLLGLGIVGGLPAMIGLAMLMGSASYAGRDYRRGNVTPMTIYALIAGCWIGLAHTIAPLTLHSRFEGAFFDEWTNFRFLLEGQILAAVMVFVPLLVYPRIARLQRQGLPFRVPTVGFEMSPSSTLKFYLALLMAHWIQRLTHVDVGFLGSVGGLVSRGSEIFIFLMAWHWYGRNRLFPRWTRGLLFLALGADVLHSLLFSYMRGEIAYPLFMFFAAVVLRKALSARLIATAVAALLLIGLVYGPIGELRQGGSVGAKRVEDVVYSYQSERWHATESVLTLVARSNYLGVLTAVFGVVQQDGFYQGSTLSYLIYVFIPRAIWPGKPIIAPGQWFAAKLGRGTQLAPGRFSNAIAPTLAGEFYMNFGWLGAIVGVSLFATLLCIFWTAASAFRYQHNPLGMLLGAMIMTQAIAAGHSTALAQLVITYVVMFGLSRVAIAFHWAAPMRRSRRAPQRSQSLPSTHRSAPCYRLRARRPTTLFPPRHDSATSRSAR